MPDEELEDGIIFKSIYIQTDHSENGAECLLGNLRKRVAAAELRRAGAWKLSRNRGQIWRGEKQRPSEKKPTWYR